MADIPAKAGERNPATGFVIVASIDYPDPSIIEYKLYKLNGRHGEYCLMTGDDVNDIAELEDRYDREVLTQENAVPFTWQAWGYKTDSGR